MTDDLPQEKSNGEKEEDPQVRRQQEPPVIRLRPVLKRRRPLPGLWFTRRNRERRGE